MALEIAMAITGRVQTAAKFLKRAEGNETYSATFVKGLVEAGERFLGGMVTSLPAALDEIIDSTLPLSIFYPVTARLVLTPSLFLQS